MTNKQCCKYHDRMHFTETDLTQCGMAGMGRPLVCCQDCPDNGYPVDMPHYYATNPEPEFVEARREWEELYG